MSKYYLANTVTIATATGVTKLYAGSSIDSATTDTVAITALGGLLWDAADPDVAAAAARARKARLRGANETELESIMSTGIKESQQDHNTVAATTATNQATTATNQATTATNQAMRMARIFNFVAPSLGTVTAVTAAFSGNAVPIDPTDVGAAITSPDIPRNVTATFGATWSATNHVIVSGTDQFNTLISEQLNANPGGLRTGSKVFATVTKVTKLAKFDDSAGNAANTCSIGTGAKLGIPVAVADAFADATLIGTGYDAPTVDATNNSVTFTTALNGVRSWNLTANVSQAATQNAHAHTQDAHAHAQDAHAHALT